MSNVWQARERSDRSNGWTGSGWMNTHDIACSCCSESIPSSAKVIESCGMKASNLRCKRDMRKSSGGLVLDFDWLDLESIWHRKSHVAPAIAPSPLLRHEQKSCGLEHERCVQSHRFHSAKVANCHMVEDLRLANNPVPAKMSPTARSVAHCSTCRGMRRCVSVGLSKLL